jgi:hypothetical protein
MKPAVSQRWRDYFDISGPTVATLFHRLLGLVFLDAWLSLAVQLRVLIGPRGLLPIATFLHETRDTLSIFDFPTLMWINASTPALFIGVILGILLSLLQLGNRWPRFVAAIQVALYLSYVVAGRTFFSFQWDNLILECAFCAIFLPNDRRSFWIHSIFRLVLFKLYWESGLAKFQSHNHDWRVGTAMASYYETAPLPTALAWYAHHAPAWWHRVESWGTLTFELGVPFGVWGPCRVRQATAGILTGFQLINIATANYGFFAYLALTLNVFLIDENDLIRLWTRLRTRLRLNLEEIQKKTTSNTRQRWQHQLRVAIAVVVTFFFVSISTVDALVNFADVEWAAHSEILWLRDRVTRFRVINTYHLFGQITTERIEPEFQTSSDGGEWVAHELWHKPGDPQRRPDYVAPHQPRVDFQLWFYGLSPRSAPAYVESLVARLCRDPAAVQPLFRDRLPSQPVAARIAFWQYHFTSPAERAATGAWWTRTLLGATEPIACTTEFPQPDLQ